MKRQITFIVTAMFLVMAVTLAMISQAALAAVPTELFFSEYIEGSSNNKALEIYNGTGAAIDLAAGGYNIQMYFNGSASAGLTLNLTGSVANGEVFVVAHSSADPAILAQADQTNGAGWFNGNDAVVLRKGTTIVDVVGQIGFNPGTEWGSGVVSTADNTLRRMNTICTGDPDGSNTFDPSFEWDGYANNTFDGLGAHVANCVEDAAPLVTSTSPANGTVQVALDSNLNIVFSEPVNVTGDWFDLTCDITGEHSATVSGGPTNFSLNPDADFANYENCSLTVFAGNVSDQDTDDPPDTMVDNFTANFTTFLNYCLVDFTHIYEIQGSGMDAVITGYVATQGVVVGDFEGNASLSGFYMQDLAGDGEPATSDGIFVYTGNNNLASVGDVVQVVGYARERFNQTALNGTNSNSSPVPAVNIINCGSGSVTPVDVNMPFESPIFPERYEGMLVKFPQALVISEYFNYDRYGEIVLGLPLDGQARLYTPTSVVEPGDPAIALAYENSLRRITLDDVQSAQNPSTLRHPNGLPFSLTNLFRGGDLVQNAVGVLGYDFSLYRIMPTGAANYTAVNPRPVAPEPVGGRLHIAAMNTLNYFITLDYPTGDPLDNKCGPLLNVECRGADSDQPTEFTRQRTKLLQALAGLDASVIGVNEIENTTGVEPLADIVAGLNDIYGAGTYTYIDTGVIGTDAIRVGLIYRPADVTPVGDFKILTTAVDPRFVDSLNRPTLVQTFEENSTGARFTVAVNHLKSKGSACDVDPDTGDGQGNCNLTRLAAAQALVDWLATDPTGSGDPDFIIMGDLNSYAMEDPIEAIKIGSDDIAGTSDDYTNLIDDYMGMYAYSYVFDGQNGYLDQALANAGMASQVTGVTDWHINADEPDVLDYDTSFKPDEQDALYEPNAYRTSDHDAVIVGLNLLNLPPTVEAGGPYSVYEGSTVVLTAYGTDPENQPLTFAWDLDNDGSFETPGQVVTFDASTLTAPGTYIVRVQAVDIGGETAVAESTVSVLFNWNGFFKPIANLPVVNVVNPGSAIPIKFNLTGDHGLDVISAGYPVAQQVACDTGAPMGDPVQVVIIAASYDPLVDQYIFVWKTDTTWKGTCQQLQVQLIDDTIHVAVFRFR
jgi:uncharacterized protein